MEGSSTVFQGVALNIATVPLEHDVCNGYRLKYVMNAQSPYGNDWTYSTE